nr:HD domain-containing phosphohydrolase [Desulfofundulus thermobenzoicus]
MLAPLGYETIPAADGEEALQQVARQAPDLILLDVMMPRLDGFAVCRQIKGNEATRFIPVLLVTALNQPADRIMGIEAGADDFLTKPVDELELSARVRSLLRVKKLNDQLLDAHAHINDLAAQTGRLLKIFDPLGFILESGLAELLRETLFKDPQKGPEAVLVGMRDARGNFTGWLYREKEAGKGSCAEPVVLKLPGICCQEQDILYSNWTETAGSLTEYQCHFDPLILQRLGPVRNFVAYRSDPLVMLAFNYRQPVGRYVADIFRSLMTYSHFLKLVSDQIKEVEDAFLYTVGALARAAEANDEETGNHILRVGAFARLLAEELRCPEPFVRTISYAAQMHDVGKIHIHPDILRKPGRLTPEEWEIMKQHTVYGAVILGDSPRLAMAREIALGHHEKYDGSGYPAGLRGEAVPLSARIAALADVYDALRHKRSYKPAFSHEEASLIITEGDGRVEPGHFDPDVLRAFQRIAPAFEETYESLKD